MSYGDYNAGYAQGQEDYDDTEEEARPQQGKTSKQGNVLNIWGNEKTMNLNNLILTNIQSSSYFKVNLYGLKTYHEVIDEIYYNVKHLEPWEKGSRKTSGQTGMCGGVRGVGAGGIVSTAFCLLYKLFTLKLTRKQLNGLLVHPDSPYIRSLGFMYIRYTQHPGELWEWYYPYLDDEEEVDCKAGGGCVMTIGNMVRHFLSKLEWFSTLFPRIPVPIQKDFEIKLAANPPKRVAPVPAIEEAEAAAEQDGRGKRGHSSEDDRSYRSKENGRQRGGDSDEDRRRYRPRSPENRRRDHRDHRHRSRSKSPDRGSRHRDRDRSSRHRSSRNPDREKRRHRSRSYERAARPPRSRSRERARHHRS